MDGCYIFNGIFVFLGSAAHVVVTFILCLGEARRGWGGGKRSSGCPMVARGCTAAGREPPGTPMPTSPGSPKWPTGQRRCPSSLHTRQQVLDFQEPQANAGFRGGLRSKGGGRIYGGEKASSLVSSPHGRNTEALRSGISELRQASCFQAVWASGRPVEPLQGPSPCLLRGGAEAAGTGLGSGQRMTLSCALIVAVSDCW